jgi:uncharacterized membrane protein
MATNGTYQVGGGNQYINGLDHALRWNGTASSVFDLNPNSFSRSYAYDINGLQIVGEGSGASTGGYTHAVLWNDTNVTDLNPAKYITSRARSTNSIQQVGDAGPTTTPSMTHAMVWSGSAGSAIDLHQFLSGQFTQSSANAIDAQGNIVGYAIDASYNTHAILWVPVPEPSSIILLGFGVVGLFAFFWRRSRKA